MEKEKKVPVESIGVGGVGYRSEVTRIKRRWYKPGITKQIPVEELIDLMSSGGGEVLLTRNLLIKDIPTRQMLDLPIDEEKMMSNEQMKKLLTGPLNKMKEVVPKMYPEVVKRLADMAIEMEIDNLGKINYLKETSNIDVYTLIQEKKEKEKAGTPQ